MNLFAMVSTKYSEQYTWLGLETFFRNTPLQSSDRFLLIDNDASLDRTAICTRFPRLEFVSNSQPRSFAANVNQALAQARPERGDLFFLNNDLVFSPNWLEPLLVDRQAILSPVCNMQFQYRAQSFASKLTMDITDYLGKEKEFLALVEYHRSRVGGFKLEHSFPYYCVKIPASVYNQIGDFDESYGFAGFEDTDYTLRCYLAGIPIFFVLNSFILHFYGKSSWRVEAEQSVRQQLAADNNRGEALFENRWGRRIVDLFCVQKPEAIAQLRGIEEQSDIRLYGDIIRAWRPNPPVE